MGNPSVPHCGKMTVKVMSKQWRRENVTARQCRCRYHHRQHRTAINVCLGLCKHFVTSVYVKRWAQPMGYKSIYLQSAPYSVQMGTIRTHSGCGKSHKIVNLIDSFVIPNKMSREYFVSLSPSQFVFCFVLILHTINLFNHSWARLWFT